MASTKLSEMSVAQARNMERLQSDLRIKEEKEITQYKHDLQKSDNDRATARQILNDSMSRYSTTSGNGNNGNIGWFGEMQPYLVATVPQSAMPSNFSKYKGYACNKILQIGNLSGYFEVDSVHLDGIRATSDELHEIEQLLKQGCVIK